METLHERGNGIAESENNEGRSIENSFKEDDNETETECCFLNSFGDISVKWKEKDNDAFIAEIDELIKKGYTFFILKKDKKNDNKKIKTKISKVTEIEKRKIIAEKEKDLQPLLSLGKPMMVEYIELESNMDTEKIARKGKDVVGKKTVAVKPAVGG